MVKEVTRHNSACCTVWDKPLMFRNEVFSMNNITNKITNNNNINCWKIYIYFNQTKLKTRIIKEQNIQIENHFHKMAEKVSPARLCNAPG